MENAKYEKISNIVDKRNKNRVIIESIQEIRYNSKSKIQYMLSIGLGVILGFAMANTKETVGLMININEKSLNITLAFIGIILGSYSLFQALLNKDIVLLLIEEKNDLLIDSNKTFMNLAVLYISGILFDFILGIVLNMIPSYFLILDNLVLSNILAGIGISFYLWYHIMLFLENINFVLNLYRMFGVYNTLKALEALDDKDK